MKGEFTTIIEKHDKWYIGYIEEISGVNTQGRTIKEVEENLKEAFELVVSANRELIKKTIQDHKAIRGKITVEI